MHYNNNAALVKRELLVRMIRLIREDKLEEGIDRIAYEMTPPGYDPIRCCVHHDRAILKTRILARLGFSVEEYLDDGTPLSDWAAKAMERTEVSEPILTVLDEACNACVRSQFLVTNACQGCLARPCSMNCPKKAIVMVDGHALIDKDKCVNCGICLQMCPYHAIIKIPVPCEEACPVGAITKDADGKERIDYGKCVYCGNCMRECPFGAMMDKSQIVDVLKAKKAGEKLTAIFAPAMAGQFRASAGQFIEALKTAGFDAVYEVALGADITAEKEAREFEERMHEGEPFMTTSCCPAYVQTVRKHVPDLAARVSDTRTPMHYTAEIAIREKPDHKVVFIGPCLAKRKEGIDDPLVDYVLSAEELGALFVAMDIEVSSQADSPVLRPAKAGGRGFPWAGGVAAAVARQLRNGTVLRVDLVDGLDKEGMKTIKAYAAYAKGGAAPVTQSGVPGNLVEVMACRGGCVAGPSVLANPKVASAQLKKIMEASEA